MAVEIRVFLAIDAFPQFSGTVFAFDVVLFLSLAKQTLDSEWHAFGDVFSAGIMIFLAVTCSLRKARFLATKIARILAAANRELYGNAL